MSGPLEELVQLLDLETLEQNLFRGYSRELGRRSVYGGQVLGQALVAAGRTVEGAEPHSLHGYFLRPGDPHTPIVYEVDRVRDGRHFFTRRVQAIQFGRPIFTMICSFQLPESGLEHQTPMPEAPAPETLRTEYEQREEWFAAHPDAILPERVRRMVHRPPLIEFRPVRWWNLLDPDVRPPRRMVWFRAVGALPPEPMLHCCVLAYASDVPLLATALMPHARSHLLPGTACASIDHAIWFHRAIHADEWLLYCLESPTAQAARGFARGLIYDRGGALVASVAQEGLMRDERGKGDAPV